MLNISLISPKLSLTQQQQEKYNVQEQVLVVCVKEAEQESYLTGFVPQVLFLELSF